MSPERSEYAGQVNDLLVWIDCEMTGLDLRRDALIEVAALVTDSELNVLGDGVDLVIHADGRRWTACRSGPRDARQVRAHRRGPGLDGDGGRGRGAWSWLRAQHVPEPRTAPLCGNSIATDRGFLARDMPALDAYLHYRMIDVSSIKELSRRWYPRMYFGQPEKGWPTGRSRTSRRASGSWATTAHGVRAAARPTSEEAAGVAASAGRRGTPVGHRSAR